MKKDIGFLFDLDGVLIDSETEYTQIWTDIDRHFPTGVDNFATSIKGQTLPEILEHHFTPEDREGVVDMLNRREQQMKYPWLPGARELLVLLKQKGYGTVLVTSSNEFKMKHLQEERPELTEYFDHLITADKVIHSKPDPEGYLLGASLIGAKPTRCAVFEDSLQGVKAGRAAGSYVVGLSTTLPKETIAPYTDIIVRNLTEIDLEKLINILANHE